MKYIGTQKAGKEKDIDVYVFTMGKMELRALRDILMEVRNKMPKITETQIVRSRISTMFKVLDKVLQEIQWNQNK